jgi:hypothetical protein
MANLVIDLLNKNYDAAYGVVNVRPVVDKLEHSSDNPFAQVSQVFYTADPQWRLPILEAMRALAVDGYCNREQAHEIFRATDTVAADSGSDEYFKSVNAVVVSPKVAPALPEHIKIWLNNADDFYRRLAFYTSGMMLERNMNALLKNLRPNLEAAAAAESSPRLKDQFYELLKQL